MATLASWRRVFLTGCARVIRSSRKFWIILAGAVLVCQGEAHSLPSASSVPVALRAKQTEPEVDRVLPLSSRIALSREALGRYASTGDRAFLYEAKSILSKIRHTFNAEAVLSGDYENRELDILAFARLANLMYHYTGDLSLRQQAHEALSSLVGRPAGMTDSIKAEIAQVEHEVKNDPVHITIVGPKDDERAQGLWAQALRVQTSYLRREWWDRREGPLPNPDVRYPRLAVPAAFLCAKRKCSLPLFTGGELQERIAKVQETN